MSSLADPVVAVAQASKAITELLRFARYGAAQTNYPFGDVDVIEQLVEVLSIALHIELDVKEHYMFHEREMMGQMLAACTRYNEGWGG